MYIVDFLVMVKGMLEPPFQTEVHDFYIQANAENTRRKHGQTGGGSAGTFGKLACPNAALPPFQHL